MRLVALLAVWVCFVVLAPSLLVPAIEATTPGDGLEGAAWEWDEFDDDDDLYRELDDEEVLGRLDDNLVITGRKTAKEVQMQLWERRAQQLEKLRAAKEKEDELAYRVREAEDEQQLAQVEVEQKQEEVPKESVVALTAETFDAALQRYPYVMAEFYAPWCGHCRKLAPELEAAASHLSGNVETLVAKIDCTVEEELCRRFDIRGFPTLKFFRNAKYVIDYELGRTAEELVAFLKKKSAPSTHALNTEQEVKAFLTAHPTSLIVYESKLDVLLGLREAASQAIVEDFSFGEVSNAQLIKKLGEKVGTAKVYRSFAPEQPHVVADLAPSSIIDTVLTHGHPYVDDGPNGWERVMARKVPIILLFADMEDASAQSTLAWFTELAKDNIAKFSFLTAGKEFHSRLATLGASGDKIPTIVAVDAETTKSWPFDEKKELTRENVDTFLKGIADGTLRPHYTSQTPPTDYDSSPVITLVGDTFEELVLNNDKDVVVDFYAPWCGHCKQLAPTWEKLGQHFQNEDGVVVAQIDAAANDNPSVIIKGFPTIYLFPAGDKANPIEYTGLTRNLKDFVSFVEDNATNLKNVHAHGHDHDDL